jgi:hypothetical protein
MTLLGRLLHGGRSPVLPQLGSTAHKSRCMSLRAAYAAAKNPILFPAHAPLTLPTSWQGVVDAEWYVRFCFMSGDGEK